MKDARQRLAARAAERRAKAEKLGSKRAAMRDQLAERRRKRGGPPKKRDRRRWWLLVLLVLLLMFLCRDCRCNPDPVPDGPAPPPVAGEPAEPAPTPPAPFAARMERLDRPDFDGEPPPSPAWIASFRMQVAARSPRLAVCFVGAPQPGRLKWTTSVEPTSGLVSDHTLEPMLLTDALTQQERTCVFEVLSDPPYKLKTGEERSTPSRVGLVIEF